MLCRVEMPMNEQVFGRFYRWKLLNQGGFSGKFLMIWLPVILAIFAAYMAYTGTLIGLIIFAVSLAYSVYSLFIRPGAEFRKKSGVALQTEVYIFTETGFNRNVKSEEVGSVDHSSHQYDVLVRAVETSKDFFLFYGPSQAYLIDKEYFTKGTPEELRAALQSKLGKKFKGKK